MLVLPHSDVLDGSFSVEIENCAYQRYAMTDVVIVAVVSSK